MKVPPALVTIGSSPIALLALLAVLGTATLVGVDVASAVGYAARTDRPNQPLPETITTAPGDRERSLPDRYIEPPAPGDHVRPYSPEVRPTTPRRAQPTLPSTDTPLPVEQASMHFTLHRDGEVPYILAAGKIVPGTAQDLVAFDIAQDRQAAMVVFDSPGGAITEAMQIGAYIRSRGLDTMVVENGLCASACPLAFAGGVARIAHETSWIGVHRAFITDQGGDTQIGLRQGQQLAAACMRHLEQMDVDPRAWIHALSTPWDEIYLFTSDQLEEFGLVTEIR
ncbi:MAG: ATP-dependent Clp protease proteolytic subunit [Alphaproteobacteria bacterium]